MWISSEKVVAQLRDKIGPLEVHLKFYEDISYPLKTTRIAITGSPATGKTTLSLALEQHGYPVFHEQAREIIQNSLDEESDLVPWIDLLGFTQLVWDLRNEQYHNALLEKKLIFTTARMWMPTRTLIKETQNFLRMGRQIYRKCDLKKSFSCPFGRRFTVLISSAWKHLTSVMKLEGAFEGSL